MPEGRPYTLGNTSADLASINATSEMSASGRVRAGGRMPDNPRAVAITELVVWIGYLQWHFRNRGRTDARFQ